MTLIIGATDVTIALLKAALFGLSAGMIACYKGISVGGGPAGVGNAVNETVVFTFMALMSAGPGSPFTAAEEGAG